MFNDWVSEAHLSHQPHQGDSFQEKDSVWKPIWKVGDIDVTNVKRKCDQANCVLIYKHYEYMLRRLTYPSIIGVILHSSNHSLYHSLKQRCWRRYQPSDFFLLPVLPWILQIKPYPITNRGIWSKILLEITINAFVLKSSKWKRVMKIKSFNYLYLA